jgi:hypothetical protein
MTAPPNNEAMDAYETAIEQSGCKTEHERLLECHAQHRDWRPCQALLQEFRQCYMKQQHKQ